MATENVARATRTFYDEATGRHVTSFQVDLTTWASRDATDEEIQAARENLMVDDPSVQVVDGQTFKVTRVDETTTVGVPVAPEQAAEPEPVAVETAEPDPNVF